ncbi:MBL fold metallo-hydrolase [Candidatus Poribacteria bacterium]
MYLQFLGTSAGEQFPGLWCSCPTCSQARALGGRNTRVNAGAFLSPDCMLDFGAEVFQQARKFDVPIVDTQYLFVTHSHADHFYPTHLFWRRMKPDQELPPDQKNISGPRFSDLTMLHVYGSADVYNVLKSRLGDDGEESYRMTLHQVDYGVEGQAGDIHYLPLEANHRDHECQAVNYILQRNDRTILYALDTGWFHDHTYELIKKFRYDLVVVEGTFGYGVDSSGHFNLDKLQRAITLFREDDLLKDSALFCTSHICPHFAPIHDEYAPILAEKGITLAYDGMKVEL